MQEGGLEAPRRVPINWHDEKFYDPADLDAELRRVFDICHGCRRCFNLCDSFPRLFDAIDATPEGELGEVKSEQFGPVVDACTLCDMCFMTKCPYVPPHPFNLDFPHLMLRARAVAERQGKVPPIDRQLADTDRNGKLAGLVAPLANWATATSNKLTRPLLAKLLGIHPKASLPRFHFRSFLSRSRAHPPKVEASAPAHGRKAVIFATCFVNYNNPAIGEAAQAVLAKNGVETETVYPMCCGMPQLEHGDLADVAERARHVARALKPWVEKGYDVIAPVPSCALMLRTEWPLLVPGDDDVAALARATRDISEYVVGIAGKEGLAPGLQALPDGAAWLQMACHARAQNLGAKAAEMLRMIPGFKVSVIERCSGHGGSWGVKAANFDTALKVGKPVARQVAEAPKAYVASECPLAADHIVQGAALIPDGKAPDRSWHPIEIFARAYGLLGEKPGMSAENHTLTAADIMPVAEYAQRRWEFRRQLADMRRARRIEVGPFVSLSFESYGTMWHQVQEMLYIEKGGDEQLADEIAAYDPLIPKGSELVATMMIEIDEPQRRLQTLLKLGGIDNAVALRFGGETVAARPEQDVERTKESGQTSSVHFLHFGFTPGQVAAFRQDGTEVLLAITHPEYRHMTILPEAMRLTLAKDFAG